VSAAAEPEISYALQEAAVQVCGTAFYYKGPLRTLLTRAGVPAPLVGKYSGESKYVMARSVLTELDRHGPAGANIQRRVIRELVRVTPQDPDRRQEALTALGDLRALALDEGVVDDPKRREREASEEQKREARKKAEEARRAHESRERGLGELRDQFLAFHATGAGQERGYGLEELLGRLFRLHDIKFEPAYRKGTVEQTDGFFVFDNFRYLIEARWRVSQPTVNDLSAFALKVERKMKSTRGLFVSIAGFRKEVVDEVSTASSIILMDGQDLMLILEGHISLVEALRLKIDKASRESEIFYSLSRVE
jgi:hypothetical protein